MHVRGWELMRSLALAIAIALTSAHAFAQSGAPCNARSDCGGQRCLRNTCVDEAAFAADQRREPIGAAGDRRVRPFVGGAFGGVLPALWYTAGTGVELAIRGGIQIRNFQFQVEVAPATGIFGMAEKGYYVFGAAASVGYLIPISDMVSWVVRLGGGAGALFGTINASDASSFPFGEFRADFVGAAIRTSDHLLVELALPSLRFMSFPSINLLLAAVTSVGIDYVF
jgi:hypothetical protein